MAAANRVAPEMQITNETTVLGYANFVSTILDQGWGQWNSALKRLDVQFDYSNWMSLTTSPDALLDAISLQVLGKVLPSAARSVASKAISAMPKANNIQRRQRIEAAILLVATSPDFIVQQ
jgi:hypothetical protein